MSTHITAKFYAYTQTNETIIMHDVIINYCLTLLSLVVLISQVHIYTASNHSLQQEALGALYN